MNQVNTKIRRRRHRRRGRRLTYFSRYAYVALYSISDAVVATILG